MSKPTLTASGGVYLLEWDAERTRIRIDRLLEDSHHVVTAEILVQRTIEETPRHIHQARLNMISTAARRTLSKALEQMDSTLTTWDVLLEQACVMVLKHFREGDPAVLVHTIERRSQAIVYRSWPYVLEHQLNLLYGVGGAAKSAMAQLIAVLVDTYQEEHFIRPLSGNVLYLDYETDQNDFRGRIDHIHAGLGLNGVDSNILYRFSYHPLALDIAPIQRIVAESSIDLVIVDSAGPACNGEPEKAEIALAFFRALRSLQKTILVISHVPKERENQKLPYGSVYFYNMPRNLWLLKRQQEPGDKELSVGLYHTKGNSVMLEKPRAIKISFSAEATIFTKADIMREPELAKDTSMRDKLVFLLGKGVPMTVDELVAETGGDKRNITNKLNEAKGLFAKNTGAGWFLVARKDTQQE